MLYLMCDVLLLCRSMTFGVNESRVGNQVSSVLHYEASTTETNVEKRLMTNAGCGASLNLC